jgi:predicted RNA-binding Zn-ribbon protein involved in translation (DUF1610 family)
MTTQKTFRVTQHWRNIAEFMELAGQNVPNTLTTPPQEVCRLRAALILEEALETIKALGFRIVANKHTGNITLQDLNTGPDLEQVIDGCADISVVTIGTLIAFGVPDKPVLDIVDKANLTKFITLPCPECGGRVKEFYLHLAATGGKYVCSECRYQGDLWEVTGHKDHNGKWIKPGLWTPPDFTDLLNALRR